MAEVTEKEMAYMAGFFDGEGSIGVYQMLSRPYYVRLNVYQVDRRPLDMLQRAFRGQVSQHPDQPNRKRAYRWQLADQSAIRSALASMSPFMIVKRDEALLAIRFIEARVSTATSSRGRPTYSPWDVAEQASFAEAISQMKHESGRLV